MPTSDPVKPEPRRRVRRLLRLLVLLVCLVAVIVAAVGYHLTRPERLARVAGDLLEQLSGAEVQVASASFSLDGTVMLHGLEMRVPGVAEEGGQLFYAETALLKVDPAQAIRGQFVASEMLLLRPVLSLTEVESQQFNYEQLRRDRIQTVEGPMPDLPHIYIRDGQVRYGEVHEGAYRNVGSLHVAGRLDPDQQKAGLYHFELAPQPEDYAAAGANPFATVVHPTLSGSFDLEQLEVNVELADFAFVDPHRNMLPRQIRRWWDKFEPSGSLRNTRFDYDPITGPSATVDVEGVSLSLPQLSDVDYEARMSDVSGTFHFDSQQIRVEHLVGEIEGVQYRINGTIDGYRTDSAFRLAVDTRPFRIPEEPQFMPALPLDVQEVFNHITPVGWSRVSLVLRRNRSEGPIDYHGSATILSGQELVDELKRDPRWRDREEELDPDDPRFSSRGSYREFPYPLRDAQGLITFTSQKVEVRRLTGRTPGGGSVSVTGTVAPPTSGAHVKLDLEAKNVPFDDKLRHALGVLLTERQARLIEAFVDEPSYNRLRDAGHLVSSDDRDEAQQRQDEIHRMIALADAEVPDDDPLRAELAEVEALMDRPVFDLGGRLNARLRFDRKLGEGRRGGFEVTVDAEDMNVLFEHFPYPVTILDGQVVVRHEHVSVDGVRVQGLTGGEAVLDGHVDAPRSDGEGPATVTPRLALSAENMPIDDLLVDVVPEPHNEWLGKLNPSGTFELTGEIIRDPKVTTDPPIGFDLDIAFDDAGLAPGRGRYPLEQVEGRLGLTLHGLEIEHFRGRHGEAALELSGEARFGGETGGQLQLTGRGTRMHFEDDVLDLLAPAMGDTTTMEAFWREREPTGVFDADFTYVAEADAEPSYRLDLQPETLAFEHADHRIELTDMAGSATLEPGEVGLEQFGGRFDDHGRFSVDGRVTLGSVPAAKVSLEVDGEGLSPTLRHLAPDAVGDLLAEADFDGRYRLDAPVLELQLDEDGEHEGRVEAMLDLDDVQFDFGLPVTQLEGKLTLDLAHDGGRSWPAVRMDLTASQLYAAGRPLRDVTMTMRNDGGERLAINDLQADLADGSVDGRGQVNLTGGRFQLELALADARLRKLMTTVSAPRPQVHAETGSAEVVDPSQVLSESAAAEADATSLSTELDPIGSAGIAGIDGLVSLSLAVEGGWKEDRAIRGRGDLNVRRANLRGLPLAIGLLQMTHLTLPAEQHFERASSSYYIRGDEVIFESLQLEASNMRIGGSGSINYRSRELDLALTTSNPSGLDLGPLTTLIDGFRDQLITLRISGTTDQPHLQVRQLDGVTEAWRDVFGDRD